MRRTQGDLVDPDGAAEAGAEGAAARATDVPCAHRRGGPLGRRRRATRRRATTARVAADAARRAAERRRRRAPLVGSVGRHRQRRRRPDRYREGDRARRRVHARVRVRTVPPSPRRPSGPDRRPRTGPPTVGEQKRRRAVRSDDESGARQPATVTRPASRACPPTVGGRRREDERVPGRPQPARRHGRRGERRDRRPRSRAGRGDRDRRAAPSRGPMDREGRDRAAQHARAAVASARILSSCARRSRPRRVRTRAGDLTVAAARGRSVARSRPRSRSASAMRPASGEAAGHRRVDDRARRRRGATSLSGAAARRARDRDPRCGDDDAGIAGRPTSRSPRSRRRRSDEFASMRVRGAGRSSATLASPSSDRPRRAPHELRRDERSRRARWSGSRGCVGAVVLGSSAPRRSWAAELFAHPRRPGVASLADDHFAGSARQPVSRAVGIARRRVRGRPLSTASRSGTSQDDSTVTRSADATQSIVFVASRSSAWTASSRCSGFVSSSFVCERPRRLWTKSITVGTPARETSAASCSGPLGRRCDVPATSRIASSAKLDQRLVEEDRLDLPDPLPARPRCPPRARSARSLARLLASIAASFAGVEVALVEQLLGGLDDRRDDAGLADDAAATCTPRRRRRARRSRESRARASPRRRARRGACPSASSRRARPGRAT